MEKSHWLDLYSFSGGNIDEGHHFNEFKVVLEETLDFEDAVKFAVENTSPEDTLILVTADHSQPLTINGYTPRGWDILGKQTFISH